MHRPAKSQHWVLIWNLVERSSSPQSLPQLIQLYSPLIWSHPAVLWEEKLKTWTTRQDQMRLTCPPGLHCRKEDCLSGHTSVVERPDSPNETHSSYPSLGKHAFLHIFYQLEIVNCTPENDLYLSSFEQPALSVTGCRRTGVAYQRFLIDLHLAISLRSLISLSDLFTVVRKKHFWQLSWKPPFHSLCDHIVGLASIHSFWFITSFIWKYKSGDCKGHGQQIPNHMVQQIQILANLKCWHMGLIRPHSRPVERRSRQGSRQGFLGASLSLVWQPPHLMNHLELPPRKTHWPRHNCRCQPKKDQ